MTLPRSLLFLAPLALFATGCSQPEVEFTEPPIAETTASSSVSSIATMPSSANDQPVEAAAPVASARIKVPFSPQAPTANWDAMHEETCEEMALIMVQRYWAKEGLTPESAEAELQSLVSWMDDQGYEWDVTMEELAEVAREHYGLQAHVETDVTVESIERHIAAGQPVIIPAAGRQLGNPYFSGEGPWYHVLTIVGYDKTSFITNDPGTRRGEGYKYEKDHLVDVIHDWTGVKEDIQNGPKAMLIVRPS